jgi:putative transposase
MSTYTQIYYHIVFATKHRKPTINSEHEEELYKYIWGIIKNKKSKLYRINGMHDHLHIFTHLHPTICLSNLVKDIKIASNIWMKESGLFPDFEEWQEGYGAFTYCTKDKEMIINYIKNQKKHYQDEDFEQEYRRLLEENEIKFDEKYFL